MTRPQFAQKNVPATQVGQYDTIFRQGNTVGGLMMYVEELKFVSRRGEGSFLTFSGPTYVLDPGRVGDPITGTERGRDSWTIPADGIVTKKVPIAEVG